MNLPATALKSGYTLRRIAAARTSGHWLVINGWAYISIANLKIFPNLLVHATFYNSRTLAEMSEEWTVMKVRDIIKRIEADGWYLVSIIGGATRFLTKTGLVVSEITPSVLIVFSLS